ncbi:cytochrome P450 [Cylindrobasidium torrendii FP15055 ss-10]|uniref:Cytochrome P450 n=1 Tax=Cylindrobasidium torrendii FP15055 ss-10 TaxID=1314674 RepID=A0A0D7BVG2_9AGAR|nr:cytochrome P450 [Cylindrobasidium torrendii FP15055 ss-10]
MSNSSSILLALLVVVVAVVASSLSRKRAGKLPPGPRGLPLLGNALDMMKLRPWLVYNEWKQQYGDIVYFTAADRGCLLLSSHKTTHELMDKRGSNYADRPRAVMSGEIVGYHPKVSVPNYNVPRVRQMRKIIIEGQNAKRLNDSIIPVVEEKLQGLLISFLHKPDDFAHHIKKFIAGVIFEITYGHVLEDDDDKLWETYEQMSKDFSLSTSIGAFAVDSVPALKYLPRWLNLGWMQEADRMIALRDVHAQVPYDAVKEQVANGTARPSLMATLLERGQPTLEQEDIFKWVGSDFYSGGSDTTTAFFLSFVYMMSLHPEAMRKAQKEIKQVVGNRLPTLADKAQLMYVDAVVQEIFRLNPVVPIIPHATAEDDEYEGYFIPKGTTVIANVWAIAHDESVYPDPHTFKPERYLNQEENARTGTNPDPRKNMAFGYGRRICPGQHMAEPVTFLTVMTILSVFDIEATNPNAPKPDFSKAEKYTTELFSRPEPFTCRIVPSSKESEALIRALEV